MYRNIWNDPLDDEELECKRETHNLMADGGTVSFNVPLGSGNSLSNSSEVFGTGLKYLSIDIF